MMFWIGLVVGTCIGTIFGVMIIALYKASSSDDDFGKKDDTYYG
jgi:hypothetical protein